MWGIEPPEIGTRGLGETLREMATRCGDPSGFIERADRVGDEQTSREEVLLADGRTFDRYIAPIRSRERGILGRVWRFRDITALKEIGRMKDEFISAVSHELRTPLTSIRGSLDLMVNGVAGELPTESMSLAKIAQANCKRLVRLINDVLDIEKISFRLESSIRGARIRADADRLTQVLENLLSNAAKYSPHGATVRVVVSRHGDALRVAVVDRGPGIDPALHDRVFEKFAQINAPGVPRVEGTGLGLNIARAIVQRLGGTIGVASKPGAGSTFHFDLPEWKPERDTDSAQ
jgi:signal transduction histidine kinase